MINRLYIAAAVAAAIALSTSFALSRTDAHPAAPGHSVTVPSQAAAAAAPSASRLNGRLATAAGLATAGATHGAPAASAAVTGPTSATPTLVTVQGGAHVLARGAQRATPVAVSEDQAMQAIFKGGMWLPNANGGREYAKYDHHLIHDNGDWTWVGKVQTDHGLQSTVITFGKDAVFGLIPQASGHALRLVTDHGQKMLVQTDGGKMASSSENLQLHARQDFMVPQHRAAGSRSHTISASGQVAKAAQTVAGASTTSGGGPRIDVMVAYTPGLVSAYGDTSAALTRITNLVDLTNQAYADSGVSQRVRLVHTMEVNYTDTNDDTTALDEITGNDGTGTPDSGVPIPSSLQGVASARVQYGADLVVLLRHFNNAGNGGCGLSWLIGQGEQQIIPSEDNAFGYSVVQDGTDGGYYCLDTTFAHELGHNMGSAHDRANASKDSNGNPIPGAYSYSFGYAAGTSGFSTIMAYGTDTQTPLNVFSNPDISKCENSPCGVADTSTSSADNVHSLNNTASLIAQFEATKIGINAGFVHDDVDGDGKSDLLFVNATLKALGYRLMDGMSVTADANFYGAGAGYVPVAVGNFNGDHKADIVWAGPNHELYMWSGNGTTFVSQQFGNFPSDWQVVGAGDVDGDGNSDLLFSNASKHLFGYWLMNGTQVLKMQNIGPVGAGYSVAAIGDFNGDGKVDIVWTSSKHDLYMWGGDGTGFGSTRFGDYPSSWKVVGAGDVDGNGKDDLLFSNSSQRLFGYWLMSGSQTLKMQNIGPVGTGYSVATTGDYNGDGKVDIVWTSPKDDLYMWVGNGAGFYSHLFGTYPAGWQVIR